jgi:hypothetical protein
MDVSGIARLSTDMATEKTSAAVQVAVLKKSMDIQEMAIETLLETALPPLPANQNIGRTVNTTA